MAVRMDHSLRQEGAMILFSCRSTTGRLAVLRPTGDERADAMTEVERRTGTRNPLLRGALTIALLAAVSCTGPAGPTTPVGVVGEATDGQGVPSAGGSAVEPFPTSIPGLASTHEAVGKMVDIFRAEESRIPAVIERVLRVQRQIHQNPEFPFEEVETSRLLRAEHERNGAEVHRIGRTGFVAIYRGRAPIPAGVQPPVIAARGELDAIRGRETANLTWASEKVSRHPRTGRMTPIFHGCGHDLHSAFLVGVGEMLGRNLDSLPGTFVAIGQPAEESLRGMAGMIADGFFDVVNPAPTELWGIHLLIARESGKLQVPRGFVQRMQAAEVDAELSTFAYELLRGRLQQGTVIHSNDRVGPGDDFWVLTDPDRNGGREIPGVLFFLGSDPTGIPGTLNQHEAGYWFDHEGPVPTLGVRTLFYTVFARALRLSAQ